MLFIPGLLKSYDSFVSNRPIFNILSTENGVIKSKGQLEPTMFDTIYIQPCSSAIFEYANEKRERFTVINDLKFSLFLTESMTQEDLNIVHTESHKLLSWCFFESLSLHGKERTHTLNSYTHQVWSVIPNTSIFLTVFHSQCLVREGVCVFRDVHALLMEFKSLSTLWQMEWFDIFLHMGFSRWGRWEMEGNKRWGAGSVSEGKWGHALAADTHTHTDCVMSFTAYSDWILSEGHFAFTF